MALSDRYKRGAVFFVSLLSDVFQHKQIDIVVEWVEIFGLLLSVATFFACAPLIELADLIHNHLSPVWLPGWVRVVDFGALMFFFAHLLDG